MTTPAKQTLREFEEALKDFVYNHTTDEEIMSPPNDITIALWAARWAMEKAEDACMSPTSKGRIRKLKEELS